jgi:hypothetical protein
MTVFGLEEGEVKFSHFLFEGEGVVDIDKLIEVFYLFLRSQNEQFVPIEILPLCVRIRYLLSFSTFLCLISFCLLLTRTMLNILLFFFLLRMIRTLTIHQLFIYLFTPLFLFLLSYPTLFEIILFIKVVLLIVNKTGLLYFIFAHPFKLASRGLHRSLPSLHTFHIVLLPLLPFHCKLFLPSFVGTLRVVIDYRDSLDTRNELLEI